MARRKFAVFTANGTIVFEGGPGQCRNYILWAIRKGSRPGFLSIKRLSELEGPVN